MRDALDTIAQLVRPTSSADAFPWHLLRYQHVATIRTRLIQHYPSPASANKALCALRGVLGEAFNLGLISGEDHARATSVRSVQGSRLPKGRAVTDREVSALFEACRTDSPIGIRDAALLGVLLGCGLRRSEVVALDLAHLDVTSGSLRVLGKGNKERMCYVTNEALVYLRRWLAVRGREAGPLFLPINKGGVVARRRLTDQAILVIVQRLARRARISELSPHDARRTFISNAIDASKDLVAVRDLAGHKSIITTASYDRRLEASKIRVAKLVRLPTPG
jgi:site-specific recombinase XerC